MKCIGTSRIGLVRKKNEDRFYTNQDFCVVADGMGGYQGGEIASTLAIDEITTYLSKMTALDSAEPLVQAVRKANRAIIERAAEDMTLKGMGTTTVVAYHSNGSLFWANVGDSRLYVMRRGILQRITTDHSMVQDLVQSGEIQASEVISHPMRNLLTRAVGVQQEVQIDSGEISVSKGDRLLLCSDGLTGYVEETVIQDILVRHDDDNEALEALVDLVYQIGAQDNVTIIVGTI